MPHPFDHAPCSWWTRMTLLGSALSLGGRNGLMASSLRERRAARKHRAVRRLRILQFEAYTTPAAREGKGRGESPGGESQQTVDSGQ